MRTSNKNSDLNYSNRGIGLVIILVLILIGSNILHPVRYSLPYWTSYSNKKVDDRLTKEYGEKLAEAGIFEITAMCKIRLEFW